MKTTTIERLRSKGKPEVLNVSTESRRGSHFTKQKEAIRKPLGKNDHTYSWEETRKVTFRGEPRDLKKALYGYFENHLDSPTGGTFVVEIGERTVSIEETLDVTQNSAEW